VALPTGRQLKPWLKENVVPAVQIARNAAAAQLVGELKVAPVPRTQNRVSITGPSGRSDWVALLVDVVNSHSLFAGSKLTFAVTVQSHGHTATTPSLNRRGVRRLVATLGQYDAVFTLEISFD
jgi:hypothetical protein